MTTADAPLAPAATDLRTGERSITDYLDQCYDRIETREADIQAWVDGPKDRSWLEAEATALADRYPDPDTRPPLYGVPVGVKDIFHVTGMPTKANSELPPGELVGPEAAIVTRLREAGALVGGKTVTTEFAYAHPGPTRNPHDLGHTPGGSSSGSAAAVAAGMVPVALGSQTVGSVIRPATFCGIIGYKPSYGRIPTHGVIPLSMSVDHVGMFTQDVPGMELAASIGVDDWTPTTPQSQPTLGVPDDAYLKQASTIGQRAFEAQISMFDSAGYDVRRVEVFPDIETINDRHNRLVAADAAMAHHDWYEQYADRYASATAEMIEEGRSVPIEEREAARRGRRSLRARLHETADEHDIDVWIAPGAPGPAPEGIDSTGDPTMNLPWTHAGVPTVTAPGGRVDGLPVGVQMATEFGADERLLAWADGLADALDANRTLDV
ncbi:MAG: amidase [Halobacteriales archaeon]|nr:amidase [Halobacteriales archaeon]